MDVLVLSRLQFGALTYFHLLFPAVTMTLGWVLVAFRTRAEGDLPAQRPRWLRAYRLWLPVFALSLGMSLVSGAALVFQGDLTFPTLAEQAGPAVRAPLWMAAVGLAMQAVGMSVALLPPGRVSQATDLSALKLAAAGASLGAIWPALLAGWMRNPIHGETWMAALVANPEVIWLSLHLLLASVVVTGSLLASLSAWPALMGDPDDDPNGGPDGGRMTGRHFGLRLARAGATGAVALTLLRFGVWPDIRLTTGPDTGLAFGLGFVPAQPGAALVVAGYAAMVVGLTAVLHRHMTTRGLIALLALPLLAWTLMLAGWSLGSTLPDDWLRYGALTTPGIDQTSVATTLPIYVAMIVGMIAAYGAALLAMSRKSPGTTRPRGPALSAGLGPTGLGSGLNRA